MPDIKDALSVSEIKKAIKDRELKRLSVTFSMTAKNGYSAKTVINNRNSFKEPQDIICEAIKELAFLARLNDVSISAMSALSEGFNKAEDVLIQEQLF